MAIENNQVVSIEYEVKSEGNVIDSNVGGQPLEFTFGVGQLIPGLETRIAHLNAGEKAEVTVPAAEAYGAHNPEAVQTIGKEQLPGIDDVQPGMQLQGQQPDGTPIQAVVKEVMENEVVIDFNHPLAGKDLDFTVTVLSIA